MWCAPLMLCLLPLRCRKMPFSMRSSIVILGLLAVGVVPALAKNQAFLGWAEHWCPDNVIPPYACDSGCCSFTEAPVSAKLSPDGDETVYGYKTAGCEGNVMTLYTVPVGCICASRLHMCQSTCVKYQHLLTVFVVQMSNQLTVQQCWWMHAGDSIWEIAHEDLCIHAVVQTYSVKVVVDDNAQDDLATGEIQGTCCSLHKPLPDRVLHS